VRAAEVKALLRRTAPTESLRTIFTDLAAIAASGRYQASRRRANLLGHPAGGRGFSCRFYSRVCRCRIMFIEWVLEASSTFAVERTRLARRQA